MMFTNRGLELMGFTRLPAGEQITVKFHALRIYSIQGLVAGSSGFDQGSVFEGNGCRCAFGRSPNALARLLLGDDFVDDEAAWLKDKDAKPPFLVAHIGPTHAATGADVMHQRKEGQLVTYDAFPEAREQLKQRETDSIEHLLVGLTATLSTEANPVSFRHVDRTVFGITDTGETLFDLIFNMSATASVSSHITQAELAGAVSRACAIATQLDPQIARFFFSGCAEADPVKRFLYFFLFLERFVHRAFAALTPEDFNVAAPRATAVLASTAAELRARALSSTTSLGHRFAWCALLSWQGLTDADVEEFMALKRARNNLSHGESVAIERPLADRAARMAERLILASHGQSNQDQAG
jgi:hypothetical protein